MPKQSHTVTASDRASLPKQLMEGKPHGGKPASCIGPVLQLPTREEGTRTSVFVGSTELSSCCLGVPWPLHDCAVTASWIRSGEGDPRTFPAQICPTDPGLFYQLLSFCCNSVKIGGRPRRWEDNASASIMTRFDGIFYS